MRAIHLLVIAGLLAAGLATPPAAADPLPEPEPCPHDDWFDDGHVRVTQRSDCSLEIVLFEDIICVGGWGGYLEQNVAEHTVRAYYCDGGLVDRIGDLISIESAAAMPGCPPKTYEFDTGTTHRIEIHHNCRSTVTLNEGVICLGGAVERREYDLNAVTIIAYGCGSPDPTFPPDITTTSAAPSCPAFHGDSALVAFALRSDCTVAVGAIDGARVCGFNGLDWQQVHHQFAGSDLYLNYCVVPVEVATAGPCSDMQRQIVGGIILYTFDDCTVRLDIKTYECVWGGYWDTKTVGPVTVREYKCGPPNQVAASSSDCAVPDVTDLGASIFSFGEDCAVVDTSPVASLAAPGAPADQDTWCQARDDTPDALRDNVWGRYDEGQPDGQCDIDVDPIGGCIGGSGSTIERRIGPVHVNILVCTPPPGTLPPISR